MSESFLVYCPWEAAITAATWRPRRYAAASRHPCDLPQRFKGALVSDVCVWDPWHWGWSQLTFVTSRQHRCHFLLFRSEWNKPVPASALLTYFYILIYVKKGALPLPSAHQVHFEVPQYVVLYPYTGKHLFRYLTQFGWVMNESVWKKKKKKKNRPVSQATFRPHIHQKHQD